MGGEEVGVGSQGALLTPHHSHLAGVSTKAGEWGWCEPPGQVVRQPGQRQPLVPQAQVGREAEGGRGGYETGE